MTGSELREYLAYAPSLQRAGAMDVPPPVAVSEAGNIYRKSDVERHLDADPARRERLDVRRRRQAALASGSVGSEQSEAQSSKASSQAKVSSGDG